MAGKKQEKDNSRFIKIAGNNRKYSDLTTDGKSIVLDVIDSSSGAKGYDPKKLYFVFYSCTKITRKVVMYHLQRYYAEFEKGTNPPSDSTARKFTTMCNKLADLLPDAHDNGTNLYKKQQQGMTYLHPKQKYEIDKMYNDGISIEEIMSKLQEFIDDVAK